MKIMHLMLACFYIDNYSYQENYLPKYHKALGHEVEIVASLVTFNENGDSTLLNEAGTYWNEYGIRVTRLNYSNSFGAQRLRKYEGLYKELERFQPDLIFCHGVQFSDITYVKDYCKKNPQTVLYIDNHSDFSNSAKNWVSKHIQHEVLWRHYAQLINPYVKKFYGVLPARVDFLINEYKLPKEKVELLVMGADDESVALAEDRDRALELRHQYNIDDEDFLVVTGGKIDQWKPQTILLMEAVKKIKAKKVKLLVFGSVTEELKDKVQALVDGSKVQYIGWIQAKDSYKYFAAADLVAFPGRHSVFWEQVAAQGIPMLVKYWDGTTHVDLGGNVRFLYEDSSNEIRENIEFLINNPSEYEKMKKIALEKGKVTFSYSDIARRSIDN